MWKRAIGIKKSHYYNTFSAGVTVAAEARCGVIHGTLNLIDESDTKNRCTTCTRLYEQELGLFA